MEKSPLRIVGSSSPGSVNCTRDGGRGAVAAGKSSHKLQLESGRGSRVQIYVTTALSESHSESGLPNMVTGKISDQGLGAANCGSKTPSTMSPDGNSQLCGKRKAEDPLEQV